MVGFVPLGKLRRGQIAEIHRVHGQPEHVHRLEELGIRAGTRIEVFRPGNPCIVRTAGNKLCLRTGDLVDILVRPAAGDGAI
ncbi:MAG: ferrous iron transport protein A [Pirellulales bacterium]|nr:ferrous iron transport protein A [Pirellulales bacterium]